MRTSLRLFGILVLGSLAGCAGPEYRWSKPGTDAAAFEKDRQACVQYVDEEFNPFYDYGPAHRYVSASEEALHKQIEAENMFRRCMKRRGYKLLTVETKPR